MVEKKTIAALTVPGFEGRYVRDRINPDLGGFTLVIVRSRKSEIYENIDYTHLEYRRKNDFALLGRRVGADRWRVETRLGSVSDQPAFAELFDVGSDLPVSLCELIRLVVVANT